MRTRIGRRIVGLVAVPPSVAIVCLAIAGLAVRSTGTGPIARSTIEGACALLIVAAGAATLVAAAAVAALDRRLEALSVTTRGFETGESTGAPDLGADEIGELDARFRLTHELLADREGAAARYRFAAEQHTGTPYVLDGPAPREPNPVRTRGAAYGGDDLRKANRRESDERLRVALLQANEASRLKSEFVATISHEIRTPMNAIMGMTELLLHSALDRRQRELTVTVRSAGQALLRIIDDVLDFSKIEAGRLEVESRAFSLTTCTESVAELLAPQARRKGLVFTTFVSPDLPSLLLGDELRIRQILINLVGNALKFTAAGSVSVSTVILDRTESTVALRFEVTDTGIGLEPGAAARLFTAFTQVDGSIVRRYGGTGLGLAISKRLVELMGGIIGVSSRPHLGSTFWFELPFNVAEGAPSAPRTLRRERVLVADPSVPARSVTTQYLRAWGMEVDEAGSEEEAVMLCARAAAQLAPYALAFADFAIAPNGIPELVGELRAASDDASLFVVLTSAFEMLDGDARAMEAGFCGLLIKPMRQSVLFDCVASCTHIRPLAPTVTLAPASTARSIVPAWATDDEGLPVSSGDEQRSPALGHVLLVEDNPVNQYVGRAQLEEIGFHVSCADNGGDAVELLRRNAYDIVFMDLQMPDMDGFTTTKAIRENEVATGAHVPIVALTADARAHPECLASGMDDYLSKPVTLPELRAVLERWVERSPNRSA